jgi:hypothetical protein
MIRWLLIGGAVLAVGVMAGIVPWDREYSGASGLPWGPR